MSGIQDQYHGDPMLTRLLSAISDRPAALEAVKHASFDPEEGDKLPSSAFAWDGQRRFPIHTREDTIASVVYRSKYAGAVPGFVDERLADAIEAYDIPADLFAPAGATAKLAAAPADFALPEEERLPLGDPEQIKVAEHVLIRDGHTLPLGTRALAFAKVAAAAHLAGVPVHPTVNTYAGLTPCNTRLLRDRIGARAATTKVASCVQAYDTLELAMQAMPEVITDRDTLLKLAAKIEQLDEVAGVQDHYGKKIFDPMKTVFNTAEKLAHPSEYTSDGIDITRLMNLPAHVWDQVDVPEMGKLASTGDSASFKQAYETLPLDIRMVLKGQMR